MRVNQMSIHEFVIPRRFPTNRRTPLRWILSHSRQNWYVILAAVLAAFGNAVLMSVTPILIGLAYNVITAPEIDLTRLGQIALIMAVTQVVRGGLQLVRNVGFELAAQRIERNVRDELYTSLLGKSMTFHNLQPVGDTMARATNDVREVNFMFSPGLNLVIGSFTFLIMPLILAPRYHPSLILAPVVFIVFYFLALREYLQTLRPDHRRGARVLRRAEHPPGRSAGRDRDRQGRCAGSRRDQAVSKTMPAATAMPPCARARWKPASCRCCCSALAYAAGLLHALLLYRQGILDHGRGGRLLRPAADAGFSHLYLAVGVLADLARAGRGKPHPGADEPREQPGPEPGRALPARCAARWNSAMFPSITAAANRCWRMSPSRCKPGQTVAIVGQTGSGKTSLVTPDQPHL